MSDFGGSLIVGKRKTRRPLEILKPIHLVLKARCPDRLLRNKRIIKSTLIKYCRQFKVTLTDFAVHADHIHIAIRIPGREDYVRWIRAITSVLVQRISGLQWRLRPYTRISLWGRPYRRLLRYIARNRSEGDVILEVHLKYERWKAELLKPYRDQMVKL